MSWFSFLRSNKQEPVQGEGEFYSQAEDMAVTGRSRARVKDEPIDPVLPEKKRARRRLIGAVALTLGLVIGLPMVLDSEPKAVSEDIVIKIPSREKQSKLSASRPSASSVAVSAPEKNSETPEPANPVVATAPITPPAPPANEKPVVVAKPAPSKSVQESAKAVKADPVEKNAKPVKDSAQGKFVIQVAALATQEKVNELQAKLSKAGIKSHTQKVSVKDGERIRIRIGPFASKAEAEKTCPKLDKMSLKCTIVPN
jgi:DedD protein